MNFTDSRKKSINEEENESRDDFRNTFSGNSDLLESLRLKTKERKKELGNLDLFKE
jgi:hypothetical protein